MIEGDIESESKVGLKMPSWADILEIAKLENEIRYSDSYVNQCDEVRNIPNGWLDVTHKMQTKLVEDYFVEHGLSLCAVPIGLSMLRGLQVTHPNEPIVKELLYIKNNKANVGKYKAGDDIKDIQLWTESNQQIQLFSLLNEKPAIVFGASHT